MQTEVIFHSFNSLMLWGFKVIFFYSDANIDISRDHILKQNRYFSEFTHMNFQIREYC